MDDTVIAAMAKWPNVPDCRGWLSLDRRGQWRLQGSPVRHAGLAEFIGRNYECDEANNCGAWFMQNGPQRVWVELAATPWVLRIDSNGITTHTGRMVKSLTAVWLVDGEHLCLMTEHGLGLVDDRDLPTMIDHLHSADGSTPDDPGTSNALFLQGFGPPTPLQRCRDVDLPVIGRFTRQP